MVDILFGFEEEYRTLDHFVDVSAISAEQSHSPDNISHDLLLVLQAIRGEGEVVQDTLKGQTSPCTKACNTTTTPDIMNSDPAGCGVPNGDLDTHQAQHNPTPTSHSVEGNSTLPNGTPGQANSEGQQPGATNGSRGCGGKERLVVVTKGPSPLLYSLGGVVRQRPVPPISPEDIVDTTGAGDSFVGGFLAALSLGRPLDQCLDCGVWTAQQLLRQKGCTLPPCPADFLTSH